MHVRFPGDISEEPVMPNGAVWNAVEQREVRHLRGIAGRRSILSV